MRTGRLSPFVLSGTRGVDARFAVANEDRTAQAAHRRIVCRGRGFVGAAGLRLEGNDGDVAAIACSQSCARLAGVVPVGAWVSAAAANIRTMVVLAHEVGLVPSESCVGPTPEPLSAPDRPLPTARAAGCPP
jgi:hypothetical protein